LEAHSDIEGDLNRHDAAINDLSYEISQFSRLLKGSPKFRELYKEAISPRSLDTLRLKYWNHADFIDDDKIINALFGSRSEDDRLALLAQHVINNELRLSEDRMVAPLWNERCDSFMRILNDPEIAKGHAVVFKKQSALFEIIKNLISEMERIRRELAITFGEVYEDETLRQVSSAGFDW
jgi:hypothetical protein